MTNVIDSLPPEFREIVAEVVSGADEVLFSALRTQDSPTRAQRIRVEGILSNEFCQNLQANYEPTERGAAIDNALGAFLLRWPIEHVE